MTNAAITKTNETLIALGQAIRDRRESLGLSQELLAANAGLHRTYIGGVERGERNITVLSLSRIASALQLSPSVLLSMAERNLPEAQP